MVADEQLIERITDGHADAFEHLYDRYCGRAFRVARAICRDPVLAEEAVQDAFLAVWRQGDSYVSERGTVAAWLMTMVRNRAVDAARRDGTHVRRQTSDGVLEKWPAPTRDPADQTVRRSDAEHLRDLLGTIPEAQREVIALAYFGDLSHAQIAAVLDLPAGTVKGRIRLGLNRLRMAVEDPATAAEARP